MVRLVMPEAARGLDGPLCGFLQLPRFCLWLGPTEEEPREAPGPGSGAPCWLNLSRPLPHPPPQAALLLLVALVGSTATLSWTLNLATSSCPDHCTQELLVTLHSKHGHPSHALSPPPTPWFALHHPS